MDGYVGLHDAMILIVTYFIYLAELWFSKARAEKVIVDIELSKFLQTALILMISLTGIVIVGDVLINSSIDIASLTGVFPIIIGSLVIAAVTAAPELLYEFKNIRDNKKRIALGDLMGAVGTNATLVIALIALINPISFTVTLTIQVLLGFFGLSIVLFLIFLYTKDELDWWEGLILVNTYIVFLFLLFLSTLV
jgi:cation:H+ antiporter